MAHLLGEDQEGATRLSRPGGHPEPARRSAESARPSALLLALRVIALVIAGAAIVTLLAITLGLPSHFGVRLTRFREPTWVLWGALALWAVAREQPGATLRHVSARAGAILGSAPFFGRMAAVFLALYTLVSVNAHLSFHTFSHDFSIFDESLYESHHGRFLFSPVLGRGYLTEHFAPILAILIPLHRVFPSPYLLIVANAFLLWAAVLPLRTVLDSLGLSRIARNIACLVYLANPITVAALDYGFHVESFLPLTIFSLYAVHRAGPRWAYAALIAVSLAIKEDVGLYLVGLGAFLVIAEKRRLRGALTALVGLAWVLAIVFVVTPRLEGAASGYRFLSRWGVWGEGPAGILAGMATHPIALLFAILATTYWLFFYRLLFTPFAARWGWLLFVIPWILGATSGSRQQATLGLYYGLPLLSFTGLAAAQGLASLTARRLTASALAPALAASALAPALAALAIVLNVAHFTIQPIPPERGALLEEVRRIPKEATVQAMPSLYPVLGYEHRKTVLMPGDSLEADYILLRRDTTAWPFSTEQVDDLVRIAVTQGDYEERFHGGGFLVLRRREHLVPGGARLGVPFRTLIHTKTTAKDKEQP